MTGGSSDWESWPPNPQRRRTRHRGPRAIIPIPPTPVESVCGDLLQYKQEWTGRSTHDSRLHFRAVLTLIPLPPSSRSGTTPVGDCVPPVVRPRRVTPLRSHRWGPRLHGRDLGDRTRQPSDLLHPVTMLGPLTRPTLYTSPLRAAVPDPDPPPHPRETPRSRPRRVTRVDVSGV